ncbi:hypothetical protein F9000_14360 [Bacteroides fragilis]|uniref:Uncharacterized protein n=2 Tax=Bacteroides fragilis TaxID=817 RepID=Q64W04_BACFR|nr:hypothetical protein F9000_14360 [Bacteroides fragilis]BAD48322.1 hypothetical protein BF1572 [Bacteroides fragilis YCH46]KAB5428297.1 hypothetical protein F9Z99_16905 [Bacteroides fragilis]KAB5480152.1 hypothetical protein F9003_00190 [Bacteroides fragilis]MBD9189200.1 hypothetical protein [Bacteroides fragilis]
MIIRPLYFPFFRTDTRQGSEKRSLFDCPFIHSTVITSFYPPEESYLEMFRP